MSPEAEEANPLAADDHADTPLRQPSPYAKAAHGAAGVFITHEFVRALA